ncbi:class I SAM-dependent methyltransferase [Roseinatronobacter alkalisoli]|uniref:Class I SAM-dependent methyltransferase n=1 Tax=Roseinatronobacter alkalisoli TaxID=3028235 RepID=A0ABT5TFA5_9RHOB|nr:class I SAM-dependent methyltransferase [Roseinatronobacter sp. HJB301]MDD7973813.1 class I SAM-dependent methyltransferase [Roseinatronobacter sp. HJB301]
MTLAADPQTEFVAFWNDTLAAKFERYRDILMNGLSHHSEVWLNEVQIAAGTRIVDVGCGWGDTALALAHKTGPTGHVLGIDCVDQFLRKGRADAVAQGLRNVCFAAADVQTYPFDASFDLCFSRFGMMFFENPVAALRNVRGALKPGGDLVFIVWRDIAENPWVGLPKAVVQKFLPPPGDDARTCGPGPFSMANPEVVRSQLQIAGYEDIRFNATDGPVIVGDSIRNAIDFQLAIGPAGEVFREADALAEKRRDEIEAALCDALAPYLQDGHVVMPSASWRISARKPA